MGFSAGGASKGETVPGRVRGKKSDTWLQAVGESEKTENEIIPRKDTRDTDNIIRLL